MKPAQLFRVPLRTWQSIRGLWQAAWLYGFPSVTSPRLRRHLRRRLLARYGLGELPKQVLANPGDTVVHAGVFRIETLRDWSRAVGSTGRVIAIEADPDNVRLLREELALRPWGERVTLIPQAVWHEAGTVSFRSSPERGENKIEGSHAQVDWDFHPDFVTIEVPSAPLDDLLEAAGIDFVNCLFLTVSGAELQVLRGAERLLGEKRVDRLLIRSFFEDPANGRPLHEAVLALLGGKGYRVHLVRAESDRFDGGNIYAEALRK